MRATRPLLLSCVLLGACAASPGPSNRDDAASLARAESAFSTAAGVAGIRAAFLEAMADDATLFRPGPVDGKAFMSARPDIPATLAWRSQRVAVAGSGELGYSSGPYRVATAAASEPSFGQFFSVWRRDAAGRWTLLIDHGIEHAGPIGWAAALDTIERDAGPATSGSVASAEAAFAAASAADGVVRAYRAHGSQRMRLLRDGHAPFDGLDTLATLPAIDARWTWSMSDAGTARSADFAWTTGRYMHGDADGSSHQGRFVRVWRGEVGRWKILAEVLAPLDETRP